MLEWVNAKVRKGKADARHGDHDQEMLMEVLITDRQTTSAVPSSGLRTSCRWTDEFCYFLLILAVERSSKQRTADGLTKDRQILFFLTQCVWPSSAASSLMAVLVIATKFHLPLWAVAGLCHQFQLALCSLMAVAGHCHCHQVSATSLLFDGSGWSLVIAII